MASAGPFPLDAPLAVWPFQLDQALGRPTAWGGTSSKNVAGTISAEPAGTGLHHPLEFAVLQVQGLGRAENPVLPSRFRRRRPQRFWDRQAGLVSILASVRNGDRAFACRLESQTAVSLP